MPDALCATLTRFASRLVRGGGSSPRAQHRRSERRSRRSLGLAATCMWCASCTDAIPVHLTEWTNQRIDPGAQREIVTAAGEILGHPVEFHSGSYGAISVTIVEHIGDTINGIATDRNGCDRSLFTEPVPRVVAHELAHTLSLDHVCEYEASPKYDGDDCTEDDETNLMHPSALGEDLSPAQERAIDAAIWRLNGCV